MFFPCRYDDAVAQAVHEVGLALSGQAPPHHAGGDDNMDGWAIFGFFALVVSSVLGWGWISSRRQKKRYQVRVTCMVIHCVAGGKLQPC